MTAKKFRARIFGHDPENLRRELLATKTSAELPAVLGPYSADPTALHVLHGTWTLVHRWGFATQWDRRAPAGTTDLAIEVCHALHVDHDISQKTIAALFEVPAKRVYWYCSRWNYIHGTSKEYTYRERT